MIYVFFAEGSEEIEFVTITDLLRRAELEVESVSITDSRHVMGAHGIEITADITFEQCDFEKCSMIVLPGGMPGTRNMAAHKPLVEAIRDFYHKGKNVAAICAAPMVLARSGILTGKRATIYPGMESCLGDAVIEDERVVKDSNIITSMGPGTAMEFALELIKAEKGEAEALVVKKGLVMK